MVRHLEGLNLNEAALQSASEALVRYAAGAGGD